MKNSVVVKIKELTRKRGLIIIICGLLTVLSVLLINKIEVKNDNKDKVNVLRATMDISEDTDITADMYNIVQIEQVEGVEYISEDDLKDSVSKTQIFKGEDITKNRIKDKDDIGNDGVILYSIKLTPEAAVSGTIRKGDKILIAGTFGDQNNAITDYVLKDASGQPKEVKVAEVYGDDNMKISDDTKAAWQFTLELESIDDVIILDKAANTQKLKLVKPTK